jgi:hypothetical protein
MKYTTSLSEDNPCPGRNWKRASPEHWPRRVLLSQHTQVPLYFTLTLPTALHTKLLSACYLFLFFTFATNVSRLQAGLLQNLGLIPLRPVFFFLLIVRTGSGTHKVYFPLDRKNSFSGLKLPDLNLLSLSDVDVMNE